MNSGTGAIGVVLQSDLGNGKRKQETDTAIFSLPLSLLLSRVSARTQVSVRLTRCRAATEFCAHDR